MFAMKRVINSPKFWTYVLASANAVVAFIWLLLGSLDESILAVIPAISIIGLLTLDSDINRRVMVVLKGVVIALNAMAALFGFFWAYISWFVTDAKAWVFILGLMVFVLPVANVIGLLWIKSSAHKDAEAD